jgi:hypothetical protein
MGEQGLGCNPAIASVVAHTGKNHGILDVTQGKRLLCCGASCAVHELGDAHTHTGERDLYALDVFDVEYGLHIVLLLGWLGRRG